ncbi:MAG: DUF4870 domain-containing protein [Phycisphaerales bacterium]|nr:DUF4870 domain-containing protein [Phycisphaerales bacterium]
MLSWLLTLFFPFFPPLIIYLVTPPDPHTGQRSFANETAREALNWQLTMLIAAVVGVILSIVLIGLLVLAAISVMNLVFCIIGSVKALQGERWTAPMTIKFIN